MSAREARRTLARWQREMHENGDTPLARMQVGYWQQIVASYDSENVRFMRFISLLLAALFGLLMVCEYLSRNAYLNEAGQKFVSELCLWAYVLAFCDALVLIMFW